MTWKLSFLLISTVVLSACAGGARHVVERRASFDMDCPVDSLQLEEFSQCSYGVRGCGRKAAYIVVPGARDDQLCACIGPCDAVLNMDVSSP